LKLLADATGFEVAQIDFTAGPFNFVRSMKYLAEEKGEWPQWLRRIRWERSKPIRRILKPFFLVVDKLGLGDFLHATLQVALWKSANGETYIRCGLSFMFGLQLRVTKM
jgi:hypothetical protein